MIKYLLALCLGVILGVIIMCLLFMSKEEDERKNGL